MKKNPSNNPTGRPRSSCVTDNIHAAVFEILQKSSYRDLSIDAVATKAGVSRPALYRRYTSVGQITLAALKAQGPIIVPMPYSTDVRKDLRSYFHALVRSIDKESAVGRALRGALASALVDIDIQPHFARFIAARRQPVLDRLLDWKNSYNDMELEAIADALFGPILYCLLIRQIPVKNSHIRKIINRALEGFLSDRRE